MIGQPINVFPNGQALDGLIDNVFTFQFYGDRLSAYKVIITENNTRAVVYESDTIQSLKYNGEVQEVFVPRGSFANNMDLSWQVILWEEHPSMYINSGVVLEGAVAGNTTIMIRQHQNVKQGMYVRIGAEQHKIGSYDKQTGITNLISAFSFDVSTGTSYQIFSDFVESTMFYFKSRTTPVVTLNAIDGKIHSRQIVCDATYEQAEFVGIRSYEWVIKSSDGNTVAKSGTINSSNLAYVYDGLLSGETYTRSLTIVTHDGVSITVQDSFLCEYPAPSPIYQAKVQFDDAVGAVKITWPDDKQAIGVIEGDDLTLPQFQYIENTPFDGTTSLYLGSKTILTYDTMSGEILPIGDSFSHFISTNLDQLFNGKIVEITSDSGEVFSVINRGYHFFFVKNGEEELIHTVCPLLLPCLSNEAVPNRSAGYIWDDSMVWDDSKFWTESEFSICDYQFVIITNPNTAYVYQLNYHE